MRYQRFQKQILTKRINEPRRFIQVIYGPRQVGKTTLVTQILDELETPSHFASADNVSANGAVWLEQQWNIARHKLTTTRAPTLLFVIDEIQKIENWSESVKKEWDADTRSNTLLKIIILGSSRLLLQQGLTESLAGRFETHYMSHWSFSEMNAAFSIDENQFVWFGGYPGAISLIDDEARWKQYIKDSLIDTSISRDILMLTRVDKPALMKRVFELGCLYSGQILSYNKILGQLHDAGNTTTLAHYLTLLGSAGLLSGIEKFSRVPHRQRASSPKFQVQNTALANAQSLDTFKEIFNSPGKWGRCVESAIGAHLLNFSYTERYNLYYWRHRHDEIDFVLEKDRRVIGIEIKTGSEKFIKGMSAFKRQFKPDRVYLIGKDGIPWKEFMRGNPAQLF